MITILDCVKAWKMQHSIEIHPYNVTPKLLTMTYYYSAFSCVVNVSFEELVQTTEDNYYGHFAKGLTLYLNNSY